MKDLNLNFYSADEIMFEGTCISVNVPLEDGFYQIMADHGNMIGEILAGELIVKTRDSEIIFAVYEGIVKVENGNVLILVDTAESVKDIDEARAIKAADKAKTALKNSQSTLRYKQIQADLARAINRINIKHKLS